MICPFCGAVLPNDAVRCDACGAVKNVQEKKTGRVWVPYMILGILFAAGLLVYILTGIF